MQRNQLFMYLYNSWSDDLRVSQVKWHDHTTRLKAMLAKLLLRWGSYTPADVCATLQHM